MSTVRYANKYGKVYDRFFHLMVGFWLMVGIWFVPACTSELEVLALGEEIISDGGCPDWACGTNTAVINNSIIGELHLDGKGDGGLRIFGFELANGHPLKLDVQGGELIGIDSGGKLYRGAVLIRSRIILQDLDDGTWHAIVITGVDSISSWTLPSFQVPAYHLLAVRLDARHRSVSVHQLCTDSGADQPPSPYVVLVKGERYDAVTKTVVASGADAEGWFNLACQDSALAKMKLLGYDPELADTDVTIRTTPEQRQATLKMITADYCGTGTSFTVLGEPLLWYNRHQTAMTVNLVPSASSEAIWTEHGAICLDVPRRADVDQDLGERIAAECGGPLPPCTSLLPDWTAHGEWLTANPAMMEAARDPEEDQTAGDWSHQGQVQSPVIRR